MSGNEFLYNQAELSVLHADDDVTGEIEERQDLEQYCGKEYDKYISGIRKHKQKHGHMGGHRWDVHNFFCNLDDTKKDKLISFFQKEHADLFALLTQIPRDNKQIVETFATITQTQGKKLKAITGIYKKDLEYVFRGNKDNKVAESLISYACNYIRKQGSKTNKTQQPQA